MKKLYQFWQGTMPQNVQDDVNALKLKAERAGWTHELYDLDRLMNELSDDNLPGEERNRVSNLKESLRRMWKYLPISMAASATSDFFRYWSLQDGGLYMDTDVIITTPEFPSLDDYEGVWTCSEQTHRNNLNTCVTLTTGIKGKFYARVMTHLSMMRLKQTWLDSFEQCKANAQWLKENKWSLISFLGPAFVRSQVRDFLNYEVVIQRFPYELCSSHDPKSVIWHCGDGTWVNGGAGNENAQRLTGTFGK